MSRLLSQNGYDKNLPRPGIHPRVLTDAFDWRGEAKTDALNLGNCIAMPESQNFRRIH
jgi:hypothetical protein